MFSSFVVGFVVDLVSNADVAEADVDIVCGNFLEEAIRGLIAFGNDSECPVPGGVQPPRHPN